jgi:hypothetical protein
MLYVGLGVLIFVHSNGMFAFYMHAILTLALAQVNVVVVMQCSTLTWYLNSHSQAELTE